MKCRLSIVAVFFLCIAGVIQAQDNYYVAPTARGTGDGSSADNAAAYDDDSGVGWGRHIDNEDTMHFLAGTYTFSDPVWLGREGNAGDDSTPGTADDEYITYTAYSPDGGTTYDEVIFDAGGNTIENAWSIWVMQAVSFVRVQHITFRNINAGTGGQTSAITLYQATDPCEYIIIQNCVFKNISGSCIKTSGSAISTNIHFLNNEVTMCANPYQNGSVNFVNVNGLYIKGNIIYDAGIGGLTTGSPGADSDPGWGHYWGGEGIIINDCTAVEIEGNTIYDLADGESDDYSYWAIKIDNSDVTSIINNVIYDTGEGNTRGISYTSASTGGITCNIMNNTVYNTENTGITIGSGASANTFIIRNNICYGNGTDTINDGPGGATISNNLDDGTDPEFMDTTTPGSEDLRLGAGSPAVDAGYDVTGIVDTDVEGNSRPQLTGFDIGAYELTPTITITPESYITVIDGTTYDLVIDGADVEVLPDSEAVTWSQTGGAGTATINSPSSPSTAVDFDLPAAGVTPMTYTLRLEMDSDSTVYDEVDVIVYAEGTEVVSIDAAYTAGSNTVTLPNTLTVTGTVFPDDLSTATWTVLTSPTGSAVTFTPDPLVPDAGGNWSCVIEFDKPGDYTLQLSTASMNETIDVTVSPKPPSGGGEGAHGGGCSVCAHDKGGFFTLLALGACALFILRMRRS
jgi:hypothetical protein